MCEFTNVPMLELGMNVGTVGAKNFSPFSYC
jgi:hypothetical protein